MCIVIATTEHPQFPLILLSNRDEYFKRPTQMATFRKVDDTTEILSPLDLGRPEHGTWIGVSNHGKIAVLVNYREPDSTTALSQVSRGVLPIQYLISEEDDEEWHSNLLKRIDLGKIGGFTFIYGKLGVDDSSKLNHLNVLSNRGDKGTLFDSHGESKLHGDFSKQRTIGISNSLYYNPWTKVKMGEALLLGMVQTSLAEEYSQEQIVEAGFRILSQNTYDPKIKEETGFVNKLAELQNSIYIPPLKTHLAPEQVNSVAGDYYGTRTQTIILLDQYGYLHYYERDLFDKDSCEPSADTGTKHYKIKTKN
ncbi:DUF833-domain-containing protein [Suhomyces tanzawaensis NRRL Y-17324]|uniref:DUF833-domain-containing protein n=1 Tax=Suhomyces tanzawaensis NRRL Y-17324 TaxID=984487 RepID=A0A1E4SES8_9ASCO|nr:DUF833-domain-containing protein [Suhomyces tanzawaensis NRRL Y-17324]ODV77892.1 DUF833-domain-containing protein [Suhomyces tanzawaensis NRRL Y-17324]